MTNQQKPILLAESATNGFTRVTRHWVLQKVLIAAVMIITSHYFEPDWLNVNHAAPRFWFSLAFGLTAVYVILFVPADTERRQTMQDQPLMAKPRLSRGVIALILVLSMIIGALAYSVVAPMW